MKILKILGFVLVAAIIMLVLVTPLGPLPGVFIGGTPAPIPADWGDTGAVHEILLEVGGGMIPRVVTIWVIEVDGDLHVVGARDSGWTTAIGSGGSVRMRMGEQTYELRAEPMTTGWERILEAYVDKYRPDYPDIVAGFPTIEEAEGSMAVFRLTAPG